MNIHEYSKVFKNSMKDVDVVGESINAQLAKNQGQKIHLQPLEICSFRSIFSFCDISFQKRHPTGQLHKIDILSLLAGRITEELVVKSFRRALG